MLLLQLSLAPRVYVADDFATADEMTHIIARAEDAAWLDAHGIVPKRDSTGFSFEYPAAADDVVAAVADRIDRAVGFRNHVGNSLRFRRYEPGEAHPPHLDCYVIQGSHLVATALLCLEDTHEGGATVFPRARPALAVPPRAGRLIMWFNHAPNGVEDPLSLHEGARIDRGRKTTITAFIYRPRADAGRSPAARLASEAERQQLCGFTA